MFQNGVPGIASARPLFFPLPPPFSGNGPVPDGKKSRTAIVSLLLKPFLRRLTSTISAKAS